MSWIPSRRIRWDVSGAPPLALQAGSEEGGASLILAEISRSLRSKRGKNVFVTLLAKLREWESEEAIGRDPYRCDTAGTF